MQLVLLSPTMNNSINFATWDNLSDEKALHRTNKVPLDLGKEVD